MGRSRWYNILESPWVYALSQMILAPGHRRLELRYVGPLYRAAKGLVLEVGCGLEPMADVPDGVLVGLDINPAYVREYAQGHVDSDTALLQAVPPGRTRLGYVGSADQLPFGPDSFDEVRCRGVLHHLSDNQARAAVRDMWRCLRPQGRLLILDNVWPRSALTRPVAWLVRRLDRGEFIRHEPDLVRLVRECSSERTEYFRYTYTYNGLEGLCFTCTKPDKDPSS